MLDSRASEFVKVYPNPTSNHLKLGYNLQNNGKVVLVIYDQQGRLVAKHNGLVSGSEINVANLITGNYVLILQTSAGRMIYKGKMIKD